MRYKKTVIMLAAGLALVTAGCGKKDGQAEITPTPVPAVTATPTPVPATPTPLPTATPAPRMIGTKTAASKFIYLTNNTESRIQGLYLKASGNDDWGKSLISKESSVKSTEQVRMYYQPQSGEDVTYDMRFVDISGNTYEVYSVDLSDMERASLKKDSDQGIYYLTYMSLSTKNEKDTKDNYTSSYGSDSGDDSDVEIQYYDDSDSGDSYTDDSNYDDTSDDSDYDYDDDSDEDDYGGDSYDDGSYDDSGDSGDSIVWDENGEWSEG